jgi:hypothetical protein
MNNNLIGLSPLWLICLALALGITVDVLIPVTVAETLKFSDWIGFVGAVIAGAMTLVAGMIAWFSVQRQIKASEAAADLAFARPEEQREFEMASAKFAARVVLTHPVHAAAAAMNVTKRYLEAAAQEPHQDPHIVGLVEYVAPGRKTLAVRPDLDKAMKQLRAAMSHFAVAEAWKGLGAEDRANYFVVTSTLNTVTNIHSDPPDISYTELVSNQHSIFTQFEIYVRAFDEELADVYLRDSKIGRAEVITDDDKAASAR